MKEIKTNKWIKNIINILNWKLKTNISKEQLQENFKKWKSLYENN
jgi:hypothetical protein